MLVCRQDLFVDARFIVIAFQVSRRSKFDEVLVADFVFGQQDKVVIDIPAAAAGFLFQPAAGRDINFAANDRFNSPFLRCLVKIDRSVQDAVIRNRQRGKL